MVIVRLIGGLGNQMYQYATARRLVRGNPEFLKLDISGFSDYKLWNYVLNHFNIIETIASEVEIAEHKAHHHVRERFFHFDPTVLELNPDVYLEGYWQSEKYFRDIATELRREFTVKTLPSSENARLIAAIKDSNAVAVHIRRGDYIANPIAYQYHGVCTLDYYRRAIERLRENVANPHFYIFSDDWAWTLANFKLEQDRTFVTINDVNHGYEDLRLMSYCKYHIIANSSFSWWGAWLADYPGKVVYAPAKWFNEPNLNTSDLILDGWQIVKGT